MKKYKLSELGGYAYECAIFNVLGVRIGDIKDFAKLEQYSDSYDYNFDCDGNIIE